jgi:hypothetical protein
VLISHSSCIRISWTLAHSRRGLEPPVSRKRLEESMKNPPCSFAAGELETFNDLELKKGSCTLIQRSSVHGPSLETLHREIFDSGVH